MAKRKARLRGKQVSKETMAQARYAQKNGLISKRAKLTGGRVSNKTLDRLTKLATLRALPTYEPNARTGRLNIVAQPERVGTKLPKGRRLDQLGGGFQIINNLAIVPRGDKRFLDAIAQKPGSPTAGVRAVERAPIEPGFQDVIQLHTGGIHNFRDLFRALRGGKLNGIVKRPDEQWGFTIFGDIPDKSNEKIFNLTGRTTGLRTDAELLAYLERYKFIEEAARVPSDDESIAAYDAFELFAYPAGEGDTPMTPDTRKRLRLQRRREARAMARANPKEALVLQRMAMTRAERNVKQVPVQQVYRTKLRERIGAEEYRAQEAAKRKARRNRAD